ncbi:MAG: STAS domain-containing protein [Terracidiphilus sp.]|jgi:anti-anti-sigma factor
MTGMMLDPMDATIFPAGELAEVCEQTVAAELTELVRGRDEDFLERLGPMVRRYSVRLDLSGVRRIDAAGVAALLSLHANACAAGYRFTVANAMPRVAEVLRLVGLERILMSHITARKAYSSSCFEWPAA